MGYKRILLKLSGEALMGDREYGIDPNMVESYAQEISKLLKRNWKTRLLSSIDIRLSMLIIMPIMTIQYMASVRWFLYSPTLVPRSESRKGFYE